MVWVWELLGSAVCGTLVGALGRLTLPSANPMPWPRMLLLGLGGAIGGGLPALVVLGRGHPAVSLLVSAGLAALVVATYCVFRRSGPLPPA